MIPKKLLKELLSDKFYEKCVRHGEGSCQGRITFEHAWIYASKQIQERWAIIPLCEFHHEVLTFQDTGDLKKELNHYYSLKRATDEELAKYPKKDWRQIKKYLMQKYADRT
jgi:hypothetical protein